MDKTMMTVMNDELRQRMLVTYGYMKGLHGKPIGQGMFGGVERIHIPSDIIQPLEDLLFPKVAEIKSCPQKEGGTNE